MSAMAKRRQDLTKMFEADLKGVQAVPSWFLGLVAQLGPWAVEPLLDAVVRFSGLGPIRTRVSAWLDAHPLVGEKK